LLFVSVFGRSIIIINSVKTATEMLDEKSSIYSDRPVLQMGGELMGWNKSLGLTSYGNRFREYRKLAHQLMGTESAVKRFSPMQEEQARRFCKRLLKEPDNLSTNIRKCAPPALRRSVSNDVV
jgi:hypothetical protein